MPRPRPSTADRESRNRIASTALLLLLLIPPLDYWSAPEQGFCGRPKTPAERSKNFQRHPPQGHALITRSSSRAVACQPAPRKENIRARPGALIPPADPRRRTGADRSLFCGTNLEADAQLGILDACQAALEEAAFGLVGDEGESAAVCVGGLGQAREALEQLRARRVVNNPNIVSRRRGSARRIQGHADLVKSLCALWIR